MFVASYIILAHATGYSPFYCRFQIRPLPLQSDDGILNPLIVITVNERITMSKFRLPAFVVAVMWVALSASSSLAQITFDKPKAEPPLPNPYTMSVKREQILDAARDLLKSCAIALDENLSRPAEGKLVTKPIVFSRGITVRNDLEYLATLPAGDVRNWSQARYSLEIIAVPVDQKRSQLQINAIIQGRLADPNGSLKWVDGKSNGRLEDEVIRGMAGKTLGVDLTIKGKTQRRLLNCEY